MDLDLVIEKRQSVRSFKSKKVDWKRIMDAIHAANHVPFADNRNHLKFLVIESKEKIAKIAEFSEQVWISEAPVIIVICSNDKNLEEMHGERGRVYSRQQAGAAINNILLKITDLGLSSCWVGSYPDELIKQYLSIPQNIQIEAILPIGHSAEKKAKKRKKKLENSIFWEEWDNGSKSEPKSDYHSEGMLY